MAAAFQTGEGPLPAGRQGEEGRQGIRRPAGGFFKWPARLSMCVILVAGCGMENTFIYFPDKRLHSTPADLGLEFQDVYIRAEDGITINAWYVPKPGAAHELIWLHGNGGNLGHRVDQLGHLRREIDLNVLMIDYRGYGRSGGHVSEEGTYRDAQAAYDYLVERADVNERRIVAYGQSLGAAVAVELALRRNLQGLILEAPFTSIRDMRAFHYPWLPIDRFLSTRYDSLSKIDRSTVPILVLHGDRDAVVPYRQGRTLFEAAKPPKHFYTIPGSGHNDTYRVGGSAYFRAIREFLQRLEQDRVDPGD